MESRPTFPDLAATRMHGRGLIACVAAVAVACLAGAGCSRVPPPPAGSVWVTGSVRFAGVPLEKGVVQFFATSGQGSGSGRIVAGAFGFYVRPGDYAVAVIAEDAPGYEDERGRFVPPKSRIPPRYSDIATSGLQASVSANRRHVTLDLDR